MQRSRTKWFRFGLRTLFVLLTIACLLAGWTSRQMWIVRERRATLTTLGERFWASAAFDDREWDKNTTEKLVLVHHKDPAFRLSRLRLWLGDRYVNEIMTQQFLPPDAQELLETFPEADVYARAKP
jgi:hypothetical protein